MSRLFTFAYLRQVAQAADNLALRGNGQAMATLSSPSSVAATG